MPPAAKQKLVLSYFHQSGTAHSIKDLEKALPSIASINGMQVKEYLQALSDDGKIRVEKIGSGNWYWSFLSEEKRSTEKLLETLTTERDKVVKAVEGLRAKMDAARRAREDGHNGGGDDDDDEGHDRQSLTTSQVALQREVDDLRVELALYQDHDPTELARKRQEMMSSRASAERWTDNIYALEGYYLEMTGQDQTALQQLQQMLYGPDYQEGEGLMELSY